VADVGIRKVVEPESWANPAQPITYTLTYSNSGDSLTFVSSGAAITAVPGTSYVWNVEDLSPGEGGVITVTGVLSRGLSTGPFANTAVIATAAPNDPAQNNSSQATVTVTYDFNGSGIVDVGDIMLVASSWRKTEGDPDWDARYDLDVDGAITVVDVMAVAAKWGESWP